MTRVAAAAARTNPSILLAFQGLHRDIAMRKLLYPALIFGLLVLSACVTINVYFPAAEAREAAREVVEKIIGEDAMPPAENGNRGALNRTADRVLDFFFAPAHAQSADINIRTPAIQAIQGRMADRFQNQLRPHFDSGALGFGRDGMIVVREAGQIPLAARVGVNQAVAEDNRDRAALYREIAVANGNPQWEQQIRETFARQWVESARPGWWYQDASGWRQK